MMHRADKATLRLTVGLGLAVLVAYGCALPLPFVVCVMAVLLLCKPGPSLPLRAGVVLALLIAVLIAIGVVMVPLLEHYAMAGLLLTATILFAILAAGLRSGNPLTMVLVIAFVLIPVAGVVEQVLVSVLGVSLTVGVLIGALVGALSHALFPDREAIAPAPRGVPVAVAMPLALRATVIVMPVFVLALINPALYFAAVLKTVALSQQVGETDARGAGRELVGSTLVGALLAFVVWCGLSLWPSLWMLTLWLMAVALWCGSGLFGARKTRFKPSFWSNALITVLILLGPAIEDSVAGKSVLEASLVRTALFIVVAGYAWGMVWLFERWRRVSATNAVMGET